MTADAADKAAALINRHHGPAAEATAADPGMEASRDVQDKADITALVPDNQDVPAIRIPVPAVPDTEDFRTEAGPTPLPHLHPDITDTGMDLLAHTHVRPGRSTVPLPHPGAGDPTPTGIHSALSSA